MRPALATLLALAALNGCASVPSDERSTLVESAVGGCADGISLALAETVLNGASTTPDAGQDAGR